MRNRDASGPKEEMVAGRSHPYVRDHFLKVINRH